MNFTSMNTAEIQQGLKAGDFSAREVAQASIDHIAKGRRVGACLSRIHPRSGACCRGARR